MPDTVAEDEATKAEVERWLEHGKATGVLDPGDLFQHVLKNSRHTKDVQFKLKEVTGDPVAMKLVEEQDRLQAWHLEQEAKAAKAKK